MTSINASALIKASFLLDAGSSVNAGSLKRRGFDVHVLMNTGGIY